MKMKKQLAIGGVLLAATTTACVKLAKWAGRKIDQRQQKKK